MSCSRPPVQGALLDYAAAAAGATSCRAAAPGDLPGGAAMGSMSSSANPTSVARPKTAGIRVMRGAGVESEAQLPFAGLHVLLGPVLGRRVALPVPQRDALAGAFGLRRTKPPDRFLVGLAVLSLLADLAEDGPLLCLVDDAHWLDPASAEALVFAARRLDAEGVALVFAARDHDVPFPASGLPELRLGGLDVASAAGLLREHEPGLPAGTRCRILTEAQGNPLGLIELSAAYHNHGCAGSLGAGLVLTDRLQQAFEGQVRRLPSKTQTLLLIAAAEGSGDVRVLLDAARALGAVAADLGPAEQARLIGVANHALTFRHPLVRAAVYQGASLSQRLAVHRALADALRHPRDADRHAWHLAAATIGSDEKVATELERTAVEATNRGGYAAAAAAYERAAQLSMDPVAQADRLASAAEARAEIGDFGPARNLAERAAAQSTDLIIQARLVNVRARADVARGRLRVAHRQLVDGAAKIADLDRMRAIRMLTYAMHVAWFPGDPVLVADTAAELDTAGGSVAELKPLTQLMLYLARQAGDRPCQDLPCLAELVARARRARTGHLYDLTMIAIVAMVTGRTTDARDQLTALVSDARSQGRIGWLPTLLTCLAQTLLFDGQHRDALASATEALRIAHDTSQPQWASELHGIMAYLAAVGGDHARCRNLVDTTLTEPADAFTFAAKPWAHWALGLLDLGCGRPDTALIQFETIARGPASYHASALRSIPDLVEAAVRLGQPERVGEPLARFSRWARYACMPSINALAERCQALLGDDDDADQHYLAALEPCNESFEQARTQLLYGAWLRRTRRKAEARTQLRAAVDHFDRLGATPWAGQARAELRATGITAPRPDWAGLPRLTPQELQITRLAAQGLSNRDIAAQLFLSPRTVGYHLYKAYPKLGVTSRSQLDPNTLDN